MNEIEIVEQIHKEFDTAQERLLIGAEKTIQKYENSNIKSIAERLSKVGFKNNSIQLKKIMKNKLMQSNLLKLQKKYNIIMIIIHYQYF